MQDAFRPDNPSNSESGPATILLERVSCGDSGAASELLPLVYDELRAVAGGYFKGQGPSHTLQPTALVHEAYLKLVGGGQDWKNHAHFCALAATAMRHILIDHARAKRAAKRSGVMADLSVEGLESPSGSSVLDLVALDDALTRLSKQSERSARLVELRFFGGLSTNEIADVLGISPATTAREWRHARAWMSRELGAEDNG
ncbi:MAG TPA: sigma-70 family RNA polymerase sigma factor [Phycisphaerae bacterium]|nr:sigma-70 family RNA polymerase sigma factor [Phycisphaerae bacterium]